MPYGQGGSVTGIAELHDSLKADLSLGLGNRVNLDGTRGIPAPTGS
jgi:hypothetical protein